MPLTINSNGREQTTKNDDFECRYHDAYHPLVECASEVLHEFAPQVPVRVEYKAPQPIVLTDRQEQYVEIGAEGFQRPDPNDDSTTREGFFALTERELVVLWDIIDRAWYDLKDAFDHFHNDKDAGEYEYERMVHLLTRFKQVNLVRNKLDRVFQEQMADEEGEE